MKYTLVILALLSFSICGHTKKVDPMIYQTITLFNKSVSIAVPFSFEQKSKDQIKDYKFGSSTAELQYKDPAYDIHVTFYADNLPADERSLPAVRGVIEKVLRQMHPKAKWKNTGVEKIEGGQVGYVEYQNKKPEKYYELIFFTEFRGQLLSGVFHTPKKGYKSWKSVSYQIMRSLVLKKEKE